MPLSAIYLTHTYTHIIETKISFQIAHKFLRSTSPFKTRQPFMNARQYPVCASIAALACIFSVNRWDLPRPNGSLESETMSLSRAARSDASSKAFMALFRGSVSLFVRIGNSFSFSSFSSLRISHSSPHHSVLSHLSLPLPRSLVSVLLSHDICDMYNVCAIIQ